MNGSGKGAKGQGDMGAGGQGEQGDKEDTIGRAHPNLGVNQ